MTIKEIIALNQYKRQSLSEENRVHYENMETYIRLSSHKPTYETEEILLELLEFILHIQAEGRPFYDVFGDDLAFYCQDLLDEPKKKVFKHQMLFTLHLVLLFFSAAIFIYGSLGFLFGVFDTSLMRTTLIIGKSLLTLLTNMVIAFIFIFFFLRHIKASIFTSEPTSKWRQFWPVLLSFIGIIGLFIVVAYFMPPLGPTVTLNDFWFMLLGAGLYGLSRQLNRYNTKLEMTKT